MKSIHRLLGGTGLALALAVPVSAQDHSPCSPSQFKIKGIYGTTAGVGFAQVTGTVTNLCNQASGVQLKITLYDAKHLVVNTEEMWPDSVSNIAPHSTYAWKEILTANRDWRTLEVGVIDARQW